MRCPICNKRLEEVYFNRGEMEAGEPRYYECQDHGRVSPFEAESYAEKEMRRMYRARRIRK